MRQLNDTEQGIISAVDAIFGGSVDLDQFDYEQQISEEEEQEVKCQN